MVLRIRREDGPDILTFTEAGGLARSGFNAAGIAITANYLESDRDYRRARRAAGADPAQGAGAERARAGHARVYTTAKSAANNMIVSQANGIAIDFECAPDETFQVLPERGLIVHANHFQSPVALTKLTDKGIVNTPDSLYRDLRVRQLLEDRRGALTVADVKAALFDDFETPWSVCRPPRRNLANNLSATVAMIVMKPVEGWMEVAMLPALNREFQRFTLPMNIRRPGTTPTARSMAAEVA